MAVGIVRWASQRPIIVTPLLVLLLATTLGAQTRFTFSKGQTVSPSFEGWWPNEDGSFTLFFGYMNSNWSEEFDVPIGPANNIEPGGPDQGQPTHFYPRRNPFLFTIRVPSDFGDQELVWTLTTHGKTTRAYASLKSDYQIDPQVISTEVGGDLGSLADNLRTNIPPELRVEGEPKRTVKLGAPLSLVAFASDPDNIPARRQPGPPSDPDDMADYVYSLPRTRNISSGAGLRLSWMVYRGDASMVSFSPAQMKTWTDTRPWANSAWSPPYVIPDPPPDGKWMVDVTFKEPGSYWLRAVASDGSLFTYGDVTVTVTP